MTTIAYKDGVIAYDSYATIGDCIVDQDYVKMRKVDKLRFFICGDVAGVESLIKSYVTGEVTSEDAETAESTVAWVVDGGNIYRLLIHPDEGKLATEPQRFDNVMTMGSGGEYALGALDAGASAKEAVKIAAGRDVHTGGKIRTFKVK